MLDPNNSKSRDIFANWATSELTKVHENGNKTYTDKLNAKNSKSSSGKSNIVLGGKTVRQDQIPSIERDFKLLGEDPDNIPVQNSWNGTQWRKVDGQYEVYVKNKGFQSTIDGEKLTKDAIARGYLQFDESIGYKTTGATTAPAEIEVPKDLIEAIDDDELNVIQYFKNNPSSYPDVIVEDADTDTDDPQGANDGFRVTKPNGDSKVFQADPQSPFTSNKSRAKDVLDYINKNKKDPLNPNN